jgi:hypothetical protein
MKHIFQNRLNGLRLFVATACMSFFCVLFFGACKKNNNDGVTVRLMNKWTLVQVIDSVYASGGSPVVTNYPAQTGEYMDFRTDGKLYSFIKNKYDTANYYYSESKYTLDVNAFHYNILILTDETMILHEPHYTTSTAGYTAYKITLKR